MSKTTLWVILRTVTEEFCEMFQKIKSQTSSKIQERLPSDPIGKNTLVELATRIGVRIPHSKIDKLACQTQSAGIFAEGVTPQTYKLFYGESNAVSKTTLWVVLWTVTEAFCEMLQKIKSKASSKKQERLPSGPPKQANPNCFVMTELFGFVFYL